MNGPPAGVKLSPEQVAAFKEQGVRGVFLADGIGGAIGPFVMGYVLFAQTVRVSHTYRFVFNLIMLGILYGQVWHWFTWAQKNKERTFIKIIVVSDTYFTGYGSGLPLVVLGLVVLHRVKHLRAMLVLPSIGIRLWTLRSLRRQQVYVNIIVDDAY